MIFFYINSLNENIISFRIDIHNIKHYISKQTAEDCLYLYIWTPLSANATTSFPVMVYIHGGNFVHMSADSELFDAEELAYRGQVIVVTLDYRLGRQWPPVTLIYYVIYINSDH